ncbi:thermonuclease family protein [Patescibacteria group bacterium]|nr:thermonuclease family protein [Patescibacteria group bacterium]
MLNIGKKISIGAVLTILVALGYSGYTIIKKTDLEKLKQGDNLVYEVKKVIDGDTIKLADGDIVRLLGIDAPEQGACFYEESTNALKDLIEGKEVELRKDINGQDKFGRLLRYVILPNPGPLEDGLLVDEYMVKEGYAIPMSNSQDKLYYGLLLDSRDKAIMGNKGLWGECDYDVPGQVQDHTESLNEECVIKGNVSIDNFGKVYFLPECNNYKQVKIDLSRGEQYFCTEAEAIKAGFIKATFCP